MNYSKRLGSGASGRNTPSRRHAGYRLASGIGAGLLSGCTEEELSNLISVSIGALIAGITILAVVFFLRYARKHNDDEHDDSAGYP